MGKFLRVLAIVALLGFPIALIGFRLQWWQFGTSFQIISYTTMLAAAVVLVATLVSIVKRKDSAIAGPARTAALIALVPMIGVGSQALKGNSLPQIHNISTDISDPPQFDVVKNLRGEGTNPLEYDAAKLGPLQTAAYPEVSTMTLESTPEQVFDTALAAAQSLGWEVVNIDKQAMRIEATETTGLWRFKDDVVIRIRSTAGGTEVDLRSVSRIGRSDLGANAARIKRFMEKMKSS